MLFYRNERRITRPIQKLICGASFHSREAKKRFRQEFSSDGIICKKPAIARCASYGVAFFADAKNGGFGADCAFIIQVNDCKMQNSTLKYLVGTGAYLLNFRTFRAVRC